MAPTHLMEVTATACEVLAASVAGMTVLFRAPARSVMDATKVEEREAVAPIRAVGRELEATGS